VLEPGSLVALDYANTRLSMPITSTTTLNTKSQKITISEPLSARAMASRDIFPLSSSIVAPATEVVLVDCNS